MKTPKQSLQHKRNRSTVEYIVVIKQLTKKLSNSHWAISSQIHKNAQAATFFAVTELTMVANSGPYTLKFCRSEFQSKFNENVM